VGVQPLYSRAGYRKTNHRHIMTRDLAQNIPDLPLPDGFEIRPVTPEHMAMIWNTAQTGFDEPLWFEAYMPMAAAVSAPIDPTLWHVAWHVDSGQVAGGVFSIVFPQGVASGCAGCEAWSDEVVVRSPWRRRGLGKALLAYHLRAMRARGLTEASLAVNDDNPYLAPKLYADLGYHVIASWLEYRKAI